MDPALPKTPPGKKWYLVALLLFILGPAVAIYLLSSLFSAPKHNVTFFVPGTSQIYIARPGQYTFWMENQHPRNEQKVINDLQNMSVSFIDPATQQQLNMIPKLDWKDSTHGTAHYAFGTVRFKHSGNYQVVAATATRTPYKVYLLQPSLVRTVVTLAYSIFLVLFSIVTSALLAIIILIKRINARDTMETKQTAPAPTPQPDTLPSNKEVNWAMVCHLSGFAGFLFPFANIIAPLLIWGFKRHEYPYLDDQGKEAINFQISILIYYIIAAVLILVLIGLFLLPLIAAFHIIAMIVAAIEAAQGKRFRYPLTIRFLR